MSNVSGIFSTFIVQMWDSGSPEGFHQVSAGPWWCLQS